MQPIDDPADPRVADYVGLSDAEARRRRRRRDLRGRGGAGDRAARPVAATGCGRSSSPSAGCGRSEPAAGGGGRRARLPGHPGGDGGDRRLQLPPGGAGRGRPPARSPTRRCSPPAPAACCWSRASATTRTWAPCSATRPPSGSTPSSSTPPPPTPSTGGRCGCRPATSCASPSPGMPDWPAGAIAGLQAAGLRGGRPHPVSVGRRRPHPAPRHPRRWALLVGAEGAGLSAAALAAADRRVRIAMAPGVDSLNVATAAAIALHHLAAVAVERAYRSRRRSRPTVRPGWSATALTARRTPGMNESRS